MATTVRGKTRVGICRPPRRRRSQMPRWSLPGCVLVVAWPASGERTRLPCGRSTAWGCSCPTI
uniref:Uncharacterized protein n=1 Tax=Arundo donax TaxID=35708 RepID=A0A0A9GSE2_ARUDO